MELKFADEAAMRDADVPRFETHQELQAWIESLLANNNDDYGKAVYCISLATFATFNFVASKVGATGFQASCADMDVLRRSRQLEHGFQIVDYGKALYPQYLESDSVLVLLFDKIAPSLKAAAAKLIAERTRHVTSPAVLAHWERITSLPEAA
jgi:hypothetical protein